MSDINLEDTALLTSHIKEYWHQQITPYASNLGDISESVGLIGFCCDAGVKRNNGRVGASQGPTAFRDHMRKVACHNTLSSTIDFGDIVVIDDQLEAGQKELSVLVAKQVQQVKRLLVIGGGHETAYGTFCGLHEALGADCKIGIINLDAHFDLRQPGDAGASSGTPFYQIQALTGPDNFYYFCMGLARESNTQILFDRADEWGVMYRTDSQMKHSDLDQIKRELQSFAQSCDALYLTIDMDVLPHYQAPGVSAPAVRGVDLDVIESVIDQVIDCAQYCRFGLPVVELTELNPNHDPQGVTARTAAFLANRMLKSATVPINFSAQNSKQKERI
ncbi:MAG: formimidoylglutamase [Oceanospirillaceae bacterium]